ncbi:hypothetical protein [Haladaptatus sp. DYSN1]|uniref:hypothetical protein n=1 Tax=unclassified Haladaptatus TaxID=2622732 RepID=UPI0024060D0E|nr:hypothetical protein [Haladaptatus sp. DYSN1]
MQLGSNVLSSLLIVAGGFVALVGLATIAGMPWTTKASGLAAGVQVGGALAAVALGAGLVWLGRKA